MTYQNKGSHFDRGLRLVSKKVFNSRSVHAGSKSLKNLKRHYKEKGVMPRTHGLKGTRPHNAYPFEVRNKF